MPFYETPCISISYERTISKQKSGLSPSQTNGDYSTVLRARTWQRRAETLVVV